MSSVRLLPCFLWLFGLCTYFYRCAEIDGSPRRASWRLGRGCNASFKCQRTNWLVTQVLPNSYKKKNKQKAQSLKLELHSSSKAPQHPPPKKILPGEAFLTDCVKSHLVGQASVTAKSRCETPTAGLSLSAALSQVCVPRWMGLEKKADLRLYSRPSVQRDCL